PLGFFRGTTSATQVCDGARMAHWLGGKAHQSSQFHHGLIEVARTLPVKQLGGNFPIALLRNRPCKRGFAIYKTIKHALDVSIYHGNRLSKSDAGHGCRCVASYAR